MAIEYRLRLDNDETSRLYRAKSIAHRAILARCLREYRRKGRDTARGLFYHASRVGWPVKLRSNGHYH